MIELLKFLGFVLVVIFYIQDTRKLRNEVKRGEAAYKELADKYKLSQNNLKNYYDILKSQEDIKKLF